MKENRGRKNWPAVVAVLAVCGLIGSAFVYTKLNETDQAEKTELTLENLKEETITLSDYSEVYQPAYEDLAYEENSDTLYYDNILLVYLMEQLSEEEKQTLAQKVDGKSRSKGIKVSIFMTHDDNVGVAFKNSRESVGQGSCLDTVSARHQVCLSAIEGKRLTVIIDSDLVTASA